MGLLDKIIKPKDKPRTAVGPAQEAEDAKGSS